jgi:hypothetical protein
MQCVIQKKSQREINGKQAKKKTDVTVNLCFMEMPQFGREEGGVLFYKLWKRAGLWDEQTKIIFEIKRKKMRYKKKQMAHTFFVLEMMEGKEKQKQKFTDSKEWNGGA